MTGTADYELTIRRVIAATPQRLFDAWTTAEQLQSWWGPPGGRCVDASIDARPGGSYRIVNSTADGLLVAILGEFVVVDRPHRLVYTWRIEPVGSATRRSGETETVTVTFDETDAGTATVVTVVHQRIPDPRTRLGHESGWTACLDRLVDAVAMPRR